MTICKYLTISGLVTLLFFIGLPEAKTDEIREHIDVYKTPTCGCCVEWIKHIEDSDFNTTVFHPENINELKRQKGIKPQYQSCHTGISKDGYIFEGQFCSIHRGDLKTPSLDQSAKRAGDAGRRPGGGRRQIFTLPDSHADERWLCELYKTIDTVAIIIQTKKSPLTGRRRSVQKQPAGDFQF